MNGFASLGVRDDLSRALSEFGYAAPTDVQAAAMPRLIQGCDATMSSATGTGKTMAYLVPIAQSFPVPADSANGRRRVKESPRAVIIAPTHELAVQIQREFERLVSRARLPFSSALVVGSIPIMRVEERLRSAPELVIGTPGRLLDLARAGIVDLRRITHAVFDEADRMFEKECLEETMALAGLLPASCSRALVSATLPERTIARAAGILRDPVAITLDNALALKSSIEHWAFHRVFRRKIDFVRAFEAALRPTRALVFVSTNASVFVVAGKLAHLGIPVASLGARADKRERRNALDAFRTGTVRYLVTSDLGARGIDVPDIDFVVNLDLPEDPTVYVHRAGRTGRAGRAGVSIVVADMVELKRASRIAVRYGFSFKCKSLDRGHVVEVEPETFFSQATRDERRRAAPEPTHD